MRHPDFFTALYAVTFSVSSGDLDEAEVTHEACNGDWSSTLTVTVRRFNPELIEAVDETH